MSTSPESRSERRKILEEMGRVPSERVLDCIQEKYDEELRFVPDNQYCLVDGQFRARVIEEMEMKKRKKANAWKDRLASLKGFRGHR